MSNTTVINSKAMQALLAQGREQPGATSGGSSFHQMLEGALTEKTPASLATSSVGAEPALSGIATKLAKSISATTAARRPDAAKQLGPRSAKATDPGLAANDDAAAVEPAAATGPQTPAKTTATDPDAPKLDETQLKVVNAAPLPEAPAAVARAAPAPGAPRAMPGASSRPTPAAGPQALAATSAETTAVAPRGFAAALANAHLSGTLPASIVDQASFDPSLHLNITPQAAHLSMDTGASGPLIAQLQITNGIADVRLSGDAASVLARHGAELSLGLTAAGLQPGRVEITAATAGSDLQSATSDGSGAGAFRGDAQARDGSETQDRALPSLPKLTERSASVATATVSSRTSHVHVKA